MKIDEISAVDSPATGEKFLVIKRDETLDKGGDNGMDEKMTLEKVLEIIEDEDVREFIKTEIGKNTEDIKPKDDDIKKDEDLEDGIENPDIKKADLPEDAQVQLKKMESELQATKELVKVEREKRLDMEFAKRAEPYKNIAKVDTIAKVLRKAHDAGIEEDLEEILRAANERVDVSKLEDQKGDEGQPLDDVNSQLDKKVSEIQADNPSLSKAQAITKAVEEDPQLYTAYLNSR